MAKIRVTKKFEFEMAHALWNYDGPCKNVHGHSYKLFVTVIGVPEKDPKNPKYGMVVDFGNLKRIVQEHIIDRFDHTVVVSRDAPHHMLKGIEQMFDKYDVMEYQPTCENLVLDFARRIKDNLPGNVKLHNLKLLETATSYAEWYASDNA